MNRMMFSYNKFNDEVADSLVATLHDLAAEVVAGNGKTQEYKESNANFNEAFMKFCVEQSGRTWNGLEDLKNPMFTMGNNGFRETFNTVLAQAITPTVPMVTANNYTQLFDTVQVGWGDIAKFTVESNELFTVYDLATGVQMGTQQTAYNNEYTIPTMQKSVSVTVSWYQVASGVMDWGMFAVKVAKSFENYIMASAVSAMTKAVTNAAALGIGGYVASGFTDDNWVQTAQAVELANGGADVYALGTRIALSKVLPSDASFRYGPGSDIVTVGYLPSYKDVPLVRLDQALIPNTWNSTPKTLVNDEYIFMIATGSHKPVKIAFEGNNVVVAQDPMTSKDLTYGLTISMYMGVDTVVGSKFGVIELD